MQLLPSSLSLILLACCSVLVAGASWGFTDATVAVQGKGAEVGGGFKEK
jgi:oligosaccharyltransferase complex subunit delta (ribophorin II)